MSVRRPNSKHNDWTVVYIESPENKKEERTLFIAL